MPVKSKIVLATLLAMTASSAAAQSIETNPPTLVLVGEAEQAGNPDIAVVTLGIVTEREHAGAALHASGDTMRALIGLARREGIERVTFRRVDCPCSRGIRVSRSVPEQTIGH
jgi:uncharacterized protein YggE